MDNLYADIAARTGGNIYIGVVGPVRTGKSTLIKRIMEELVIPGIDDPYRRERARDELPQSGSGRTIMTSEPKFIPEEAAEISPDGKTKLRVRMIDSVGYMVPGAALASTGAFLFFQNKKYKLKGKKINIIKKISSLSIGVYYIHMLVLAVVEHVGIKGESSILILGAKIVATYIISLFCAFTISKIPVVRKFLLGAK